MTDDLHPVPKAPDPLVVLYDLLVEIVDILRFESGYELARSGGVGPLAGGNVDEVLSQTTTVTLLEPNGYRRGASIYNDSTSVLYVKLGAGADANDWSVQLAAGDYYEPPRGYRGEVSGVWATAEGQARVTEFN